METIPSTSETYIKNIWGNKIRTIQNVNQKQTSKTRKQKKPSSPKPANKNSPIQQSVELSMLSLKAHNKLINLTKRKAIRRSNIKIMPVWGFMNKLRINNVWN
jgi:hypothetical protein